MIDATLLFSKVMYRSLHAFGTILTYRQTANLAIDAARNRLINIERMHAENAFKLGYIDQFFCDKDGFLQLVGDIQGWANLNSEKRSSEFLSFTEASSLIFAHSILDAIALDLCTVTVSINPSAWIECIRTKKVWIEELLAKPASEIEAGIALKYVENLERESLMKKVDHLFSICKPPQDFAPSQQYAYERERLAAIDEMRHDMVHSDLPSSATVSPNEIKYLQQTAIFLCAMVSRRFAVKADVRKLMATTDKTI